MIFEEEQTKWYMKTFKKSKN